MSINFPISITIKDLPPSPALESVIQKRFEKLSQFYDQIIKCTAVVKLPQKRKLQGKIFNLCIEIHVPGQKIVINRSKNEDIYIAIRDAFLAAEKTLKEYANRRRGSVKHHKLLYHGRIARLFEDEGFGFIECNGDEYYFSFANISHPTFDKLSVGQLVQFIPAFADEGLQARRVSVGKHYFIELEEYETH